MALKKIIVEVVVDTVCPWCFIGKRRLEKAMGCFSDKAEFEVHWLPFQLNPDAPQTGVAKREYYKLKFGEARSEALQANMARTFEAEGMKYDMDGLTGNTFNSHRLLTWVGHQHGWEKQNQLVEELFKNYFTEGKYINDTDVLVAAAETVGVVGARPFLEDPEAGAAEVRALLREKAQGIGGVPFYVIDGRHRLSGAQPPENFVSVFQQLV